jgi:pimeloyl-ACP methyl ester carboxylesterase
MKKLRTWILILVGIAALLGINYLFFSGTIYGLDDRVKTALQSDAKVEITFMEDGGWMVLTPLSQPPTTGLILYPEGRMDVQSYAPIGRQLAEAGYQVIFLSRRLDRVLDQTEENQRIAAVMDAFPQIEKWVVGGHTWSGSIAAIYALANPDKVAGIVLWAARLDASSDLSDSGFPVLVVYGTRDDENTDMVANVTPFLPADTVWISIEGGNRVQFGDYGPMAADVGATISNEEQQAQTVEAMLDFLDSIK